MVSKQLCGQPQGTSNEMLKQENFKIRNCSNFPKSVFFNYICLVTDFST